MHRVSWHIRHRRTQFYRIGIIISWIPSPSTLVSSKWTTGEDITRFQYTEAAMVVNYQDHLRKNHYQPRICHRTALSIEDQRSPVSVNYASRRRHWRNYAARAKVFVKTEIDGKKKYSPPCGTTHCSDWVRSSALGSLGSVPDSACCAGSSSLGQQYHRVLGVAA